MAFELLSLEVLSQGVHISHSPCYLEPDCHFGALCSCVLVETDTNTVCFSFTFLQCLLKKFHVYASYLTTEQKVILIITFQTIFLDSYTDFFFPSLISIKKLQMRTTFSLKMVT